MEIEHLKLKTGELETCYLQTGSAHEQTIVLLHGSGPGANAMSNWMYALPYLGDNYHCLAPDLAGFGESLYQQPPQGVAAWIDIWVRQIIGLMDNLSLDTVHLVGNSMGGAVALHLINRYPERFDHIALMGSVGVPFLAGEGLRRGWGFYQVGTQEELAYLVGKFLYNPSILGSDIQSIAEQRHKVVMRDEIRQQFEAMFPGHAQVHVDSLVISDHELTAIPNRVLITHGREDYFIPLENSYYLLERLKNAQLHVFSSCGHWIQIEQRNAFNQLIKNFFDGALD